VPIYLYMPLPLRLDEAVASKVPAARRDRFNAVYAKYSDGFRLVRSVPPSERDEVWLALEEAGYDLAHADYKAAGRLRPVQVSFVVTQVAGTAAPRLEAVTLVSGSGDPDVDTAVMYGFRRASFFNATDGAVSGTFTYSFER
jgi:hypothetical protein